MADIGTIGLNTRDADQNPDKKKKKKKPDLPVVPIKTTADYQRMKLERLFANPEKPVVIPIRPKDKNQAPPPEFVRNVMGSSAGAGSGEFHVYRHLRRKEYARQKTIGEKAKLEELDNEYQQKIEENKKIAELKTAKKRAKRLKRKEKLKKKKIGKSNTGEKGSNNDSSDDSNKSDDDSDAEEDNNTKSNKSTGHKNGSSNNSLSNKTNINPQLSSKPVNSGSSSDSD